MITGTDFLQRHAILHDFWLDQLWDGVPAELWRARAHPRANPIAWNVWHLLRVEDASVNRFVVRRPQVLDDGGWLARLGVSRRDNGFGMSAAEVDDLAARVDLAALRGYCREVGLRTQAVVPGLDAAALATLLDADHLRAVLVDEGLAPPEAAPGLLENYRQLTAGACLLNHALTHPFHHVGQIELVARMHGLTFE